MIVTEGSQVWKVPGTDGLVLAVAAAVGSPSVSAALPWRWPRPVKCTGVLVIPRANAVATMQQKLAMASVSIIDETGNPIIFDTRATLRGTNNAPASAGLLALQGRGFAPFALQRPVNVQRQWQFYLQNDDPANVIVIAGIFLYWENLQ